ncbi:MAG TPA: hypothetical protein VFB62_16515 [Polyangiaceae bacterium]|nr:hypothetical protein [Polyangiaceae bacterium]
MSSSAPDYAVAQPHTDADELFVRIRRQSVEDDSVNTALFRWTYRDAADGAATALMLESRGHRKPEAIGWIGLQPRTLFADGRALRAALLLNLVVTPEHRTVRPALMLQRHAHRIARANFDVSLGYPNQAALGGFLRSGYHHLGPIRRYAAVLRHAPMLERRGLPPPVSTLAGGAADVVLAAVRRRRWLRWTSRFALEWPAEVDARFDRLWLRTLEADAGVLGRRDAALLRWRYLENPSERYSVAALVRNPSGELCGYAAVTRDGSRVHLSDLCALDDHSLGVLVDALLEVFYREKASVVDVCFLGRATVRELLLARGFRAREVVRHAIVDASPTAGLDPSLLADSGRWHLTAGDGDL